ncbi:MAG TPA: FtsX-like permease family protein [Vicinamibacterales bacterium]|nr:FtsX-like permease family protein [Vicinamibacterales bacterium]
MKASTLRLRSLRHYWRTNLAVIGGVAIAVAVLSGALMVGVSVRASLRDLVLQRLGNADRVIVSQGFFREQLAAAFDAGVPMLVAEGFVSAQPSGRRASRVQVYAIDNRFYRFHGLGRVQAPTANDALLSEGLAAELGAAAGQSVILRVETSSAIPTDSLHGRKEDAGRSVRLTVRQVLAREDLGEFSLSPRQGSVRAIFVPLARMQTLLEQRDRANAILIAGSDTAAVERKLRESALVDDFGVRVRVLDALGAIAVESRSTILNEASAAAAIRAAERTGLNVIPTLTYLANSIRAGGRAIPYSTITAIDLSALGWVAQSAEPGTRNPQPGPRTPEPIVLNEWAAKDLGAAIGDPITVEYYVWGADGRLRTETADFGVARIVPIVGPGADRDLVPEYPGITDSDRIGDWDPPFPIDLQRVRPVDEEYWNQYRATPKAFIAIERGQQLWSSRHGGLTALRLIPPFERAAPKPESAPLAKVRDEYEHALLGELDPLAMGFSVYDVRAQGLAASSGATDFGEYFTYFSCFLVVSALLLAGLFFKLGIEQRLQEVGLLQALGLGPDAIRRLFVGEALVLAGIGGIVGIAGAIAYSALIMLGLRTWWVDAVGTTALTLHVDALSLIAGAFAVVAIAVVSIRWSLRTLATASARALIKGSDPLFTKSERRAAAPLSGIATGVLAIVLLAGSALGFVPRVAGFFGAGALSLIAMLCLASVCLRCGRWGVLHGHGVWAVWRLGWRNTAYHPSRSVLCIALIAFATFVIVAVEAFKRNDAETLADRHSGGGGYPLLMETLLPIVHDLNDAAGRDVMNLPTAGALQNVRFDRFRVRPGDDTSCLNLYQPKNPRIIAATADFINSGRFPFSSSLAESPEERANPWLLLARDYGEGVVPVVTDANSMTYVLHMKLGDDFVLPGSSTRPTKLRLVAALSDSIFQGELVMAEAPFMRLFPEWEGYRFFLADAPPAETGALVEMLESRLSDFGADAASAADRIAGFHRVEYTYLSTFQTLGGLGLVLGTLGLGAILLRNVMERRRELALLRALGYTQSDFLTMVVAENVLLLIGGLLIGALCALIAIAPTLLDRGGRLPLDTLALLLAGVLGTGLLASLGATIAALRSPLLSALRAE